MITIDFSKKNDKKVKKDIIYFFNKFYQSLLMNVEMRSITTILGETYKEKNDSNRYFIDSPRYLYMDELSKYVAIVNADKIFYKKNNTPRRGFFYYEYAINESLNTIYLKNYKFDEYSEKEYSLFLTEKYLPIVHSTIYDKILKWEEVKICKDIPENSNVEFNYVMYLFDQDSIQDITYCTFSTFVFVESILNNDNIEDWFIHYSECLYFEQIKHVAKSIASDDKIKELKKEQENSNKLIQEAEIGRKTYENHVKQFAHVNVNLGKMDSSLDIIQGHIENNEYTKEEALNILERMRKYSKVLHIMNSAIIGNDSKVKGYFEGKNIRQLIEFARDSFLTKIPKKSIIQLGNTDEIDKANNEILKNSNNSLYFFILFYNLYANILNGESNIEYDVTMQNNNDNTFSVIFQNNKPIESDFLNYVNIYLEQPNVVNLNNYPTFKHKNKGYGGLTNLLEIISKFPNKIELKPLEPEICKTTFHFVFKIYEP